MGTTLTDRHVASTATRTERNRSVKLEWEVGTLPAKDGYAERKVVAVLTVSHHKAGANAFSGETTTEDHFNVSLVNETIEDRGNGFVARGFKMFSGLGLARLPAGNRFSAKKLREAADTGYAVFREAYESGDERVLRYFNAEGVDD